MNSPQDGLPLQGLHVLSLESRRAAEMATLISRYGGIPFVAPSVKEQAVTDPAEAIRFIEDLEAGAYDLVIWMTGVAVTFMMELLAPFIDNDRIAAALRRATMCSRGPKPVGALRKLGVPVSIIIPEPNTWREVVAGVAERNERRIAIQEYGKLNPEMTRALEALGAQVSSVSLYRWELPDDLEPLRRAAHRVARGEFEMVLFTSSIQLAHLLEIARRIGIEQEVRAALRKAAIGSIGPVMTETLIAHGFPPAIEPHHPKMPSLVKSAAEFWAERKAPGPACANL